MKGRFYSRRVASGEQGRDETVFVIQIAESRVTYVNGKGESCTIGVADFQEQIKYPAVYAAFAMLEQGYGPRFALINHNLYTN